MKKTTDLLTYLNEESNIGAEIASIEAGICSDLYSVSQEILDEYMTSDEDIEEVTNALSKDKQLEVLNKFKELEKKCEQQEKANKLESEKVEDIIYKIQDDLESIVRINLDYESDVSKLIDALNSIRVN